MMNRSITETPRKAERFHASRGEWRREGHQRINVLQPLKELVVNDTVANRVTTALPILAIGPGNYKRVICSFPKAENRQLPQRG